MMHPARFCRNSTLLFLLFISILGLSQENNKNNFVPSNIKEKIKQALAISIADSTNAKKIIDEIITEAEKNNDRLIIFEAYSAKTKILTLPISSLLKLLFVFFIF